jgi:hypothetical protein
MAFNPVIGYDGIGYDVISYEVIGRKTGSGSSG